MLKQFGIVTITLVMSSGSIAQSLPQLRMSPDEVRERASRPTSNQIGSSGASGVQTTVLFGDPAKEGFYTILLYVPPHTTIQAHSHRDNRMAAVLSGSWHFAYGTAFDEKSLKDLPPGSIYSEPAGMNHFARTDDTASIVQVSGFGPTDTHYFDPVNDPKLRQK